MMALAKSDFFKKNKTQKVAHKYFEFHIMLKIVNVLSLQTKWSINKLRF